MKREICYSTNMDFVDGLSEETDDNRDDADKPEEKDPKVEVVEITHESFDGLRSLIFVPWKQTKRNAKSSHR